MTKLYYLKWPLTVFILGFISWIIAHMMKVLHWQGGDIALMIATAIVVMALIFLAIKVMILKK